MTRRDSSPSTAAALLAAFGSRPFSVDDAYAAGVTRRQLQTAREHGAVTTLRRGVLAVADDDPFHAVRAALLSVGDAVASHDTGLRVHGLPDPHEPSPLIHLTSPVAKSRPGPGIRVHWSPLPEHHRTIVDGIAVTSIGRTTVDMARSLTMPRALIVMDAALRRHVLDSLPPEEDPRHAVREPHSIASACLWLQAHLRDQTGWPGVVRARLAAELADPAAESPFESLSRGTLAEYGVPMPECGAPVVGADGVTYWADMLWRELGVIGECDGLKKYDAPDRLHREKLRQEALEQAGWIVVRWTWDELIHRPQAVVARLQRAFRMAAQRRRLAS